ncbi:hypothetical protein DAI22_01g059400 [Oryza sativa Japonica Group]|nr:hypothetical protein DAI22_01g059400 [Oryza sativa Japonica Group]
MWRQYSSAATWRSQAVPTLVATVSRHRSIGSSYLAVCPCGDAVYAEGAVASPWLTDRN